MAAKTPFRLRHAALLAGVLLLGIGASALALSMPFWLLPRQWFASPWIGAVTHTTMWVISLLLSLLFTRGHLACHGYSLSGYRFKPRILLWALPMATVSTLGFLLAGPQQMTVAWHSCIKDILFVWIYASICEELLTRGLLQSLLAPLRAFGIAFGKKRFLSLPVLFSGIFFGMMHIVAVPKMGPAVLVFTTFCGLVAAYYREKTGSLVPAVIIHSLFNIGGVLPAWLLYCLLA